MPNIVDYLSWRGDLTLSERPFNDVDSVIFSAFAYLDLTDIVPGPGEGSVSLSEACRRVVEVTGGDVGMRVRSLTEHDPALVFKLGNSKRFGGAALHDYVDIIDESRSLQFAAIMIDVSPHETYVAFRGTDSTLVGWREDFMLSFTTTEAQYEAARYLESAAEWARVEGRGLYVGGHSKGGNLAVYAALSCPLTLLPAIACVWSNDGPGLNPELFRVSPQVLLGERYRRIVPSDDMVGIIFERQDDPRIVVSSKGSGISQHDPFAWQVNAFGVQEEADLSPESKAMQRAIDDWVTHVPPDRRAIVVDELFDALGAGGATTFDDVASTPQGLSAVISAMNNMDDSTKTLLVQLVGDVVSNAFEAATSAAQEAAYSAFQSAKSALLARARRSERLEDGEAETQDDVAGQDAQTELS